jgi:hypothetical protein
MMKYVCLCVCVLGKVVVGVHVRWARTLSSGGMSL